MSRTRVHTKLEFIIPPEDIEQHQTSWFTIKRWMHTYNKFYGRYSGEKVLRKTRNRQERAQLRTDLKRMQLDPEEFDNYTPPAHHDTLWDLE